ncbi:MAG: hypothetical protein AAGF22_13400 [Pseudomonadota bacterium]
MGRIGAVLALLALTGCGVAARLNPLNLFTTDREEVVLPSETLPEVPVVDQVLSLTVDPTPGGVIISAVGLPPTQGFWLAELAPIPSEDPAALVLAFQIEPPLTPRPAGTQPSREVLVGLFASNQDLAGVRTITVRGALNQRTISRQ